MYELVHDAFGFQGHDSENDDDTPHVHREEPDQNVSKFFKLLNDANSELYNGCKKYSMLSFIIRIFQMKVLSKWSHTSCTMLLELLKDAFQLHEKFPSSYQKLRKMVKI